MTAITTKYLAPEISCDHCASSIHSAVSALEGVDSVTVDIATKQVTVIGGQADAIVAALGDAGFDVA